MTFLADALSDTHSRAQAEAIADWIGTDPERFAELVALLLGPDPLLAQRAAWPLRVVGETYPTLLAPHWPALIDRLGQPAHPALPRNILALASAWQQPWEEEVFGWLVDHSFRLLEQPSAPVAIKAHAMTVLHSATQREPGLIPELEALIEAQLPLGSAGFVNRGQKILRALREARTGRVIRQRVQRKGPF